MTSINEDNAGGSTLRSSWRPRPIALAGLLGIIGSIVLLTVLFPRTNPYPWNYVSSLLGWTYLAAWSVSFYPQIVLLRQRKSTDGLSFDFVWLNALGFLCYSIYNLCLFANAGVISSYEERSHGETPLVAFNDVVFSVHAAIITLVTLIHMYSCGYESVGKFSGLGKVFIAFAAALSVIYCLAVISNGDGAWKNDQPFMYHNLLTWLSVVYFLSFVKLTISTVKYMPQAYLNFARKSTMGWSIANVLLDFTGGSLSVAQLMVDGFHGQTPNNWAGIVGNPVKFGLGFVSMFFDVLFMVQHYILYRNAHLNSNTVVHDFPTASASGDSERVPLRMANYDGDSDSSEANGMESEITSPMLVENNLHAQDEHIIASGRVGGSDSDGGGDSSVSQV